MEQNSNDISYVSVTVWVKPKAQSTKARLLPEE